MISIICKKCSFTHDIEGSDHDDYIVKAICNNCKLGKKKEEYVVCKSCKLSTNEGVKNV